MNNISPMKNLYVIPSMSLLSVGISFREFDI